MEENAWIFLMKPSTPLKLLSEPFTVTETETNGRTGGMGNCLTPTKKPPLTVNGFYATA